MKNKTYILAIDTSCDDTSAAVVSYLPDTKETFVLSNVVASQTELHKPFGGVFPTVAKQAHKENIDRVVTLALRRARIEGASLTPAQIDAVAVTQGPGLAPALEVGITRAKELAEVWNKPLIAVNHIEAHALSPLAKPQPKKTSLSKKSVAKSKKSTSPQFPVLSLVISGGHSLFVLITALGEYTLLGSTIDDAAGECLDKVGRLLNLGYPAGPVIEQFAKLGNPKAFGLPLPMTHIQDFNLSFSGLKTHARNIIEAKTVQKALTKQEIYDFCASIQYSVFRHICYKLNKILQVHNVQEVWLGGGVAANATLRQMIRQTIREQAKHQKTQSKVGLKDTRAQNVAAQAIPFRTPYSKRLCMDNAAMIGVVGGYKLSVGQIEKEPSLVDRMPRLSF